MAKEWIHLKQNTNLYWSIKWFSNTDHNWGEENPEDVVHEKSSLKLHKELSDHSHNTINK